MGDYTGDWRLKHEFDGLFRAEHILSHVKNGKKFDKNMLSILIERLCFVGLKKEYFDISVLDEIVEHLSSIDWGRYILWDALYRAMALDAHVEYLYSKQNPCIDCGESIGFGYYKKRKNVLIRCPRCNNEYIKSMIHECIDCGNRYFQGDSDYFCDECCSNYCFEASDYAAELKRVKDNNYRANKIGEPSDLKVFDWQYIVNQFAGRCAYCGGEFECLEHFIPLGHGIGTTKNNCVPACISCNSKKRDKHPIHDYKVLFSPKSKSFEKILNVLNLDKFR